MKELFEAFIVGAALLIFLAVIYSGNHQHDDDDDCAGANARMNRRDFEALLISQGVTHTPGWCAACNELFDSPVPLPDGFKAPCKCNRDADV